MAPPLLALLRRDDPNAKYNPGQGSRAPDTFNNNIFLILFAVIGSALALLCLWFFTMAKHGGFHWKKNDWEDYKSTVLRRKGPDGKTLSNATRSTKLGGGSIVPKWAEDKSSHVSKSSVDSVSDVGGKRGSRSVKSDDPEFDAYRHEKAAAVGGLNKPVEGSHYDYTSTEPSTYSAPNQKMSRKDKKEQARKAKEQAKQPKHKKSAPRVAQPPSVAQSASTHESGSYFGVPQDSPSSAQRNVHYSNYRSGQTVRAVNDDSSPGTPHRNAYRNSAERGSPQRKSHRREESLYSSNTEDTGTKSYPHSIPGLTKGEVGIYDSISQVGASNREPRRYGPSGYRRN